MVWGKYQSEILTRVFFWNIVYLVTFIILSSFDVDKTPYIGNFMTNPINNLMFAINLLFTFVLFIFDYWVEYKQIV